jgi:hypothetical protein
LMHAVYLRFDGVGLYTMEYQNEACAESQNAVFFV